MMYLYIMNNSKEILSDVLSKTSINVFNIAITHYNIQGLYERHRNHLVNTYFDGSLLKYSVGMRAIFDQFQTTEQEQKAKALNDKMYFLSKDIRSKKKYKQPHQDEAARYNEMVLEHNQLNKGIVTLTKLFKTLKSI